MLSNVPFVENKGTIQFSTIEPKRPTAKRNLDSFETAFVVVYRAFTSAR